MAQGTEVDRLFVSMGMDLSGLRKGAKDLSKSMDSMGQRVQQAGRSMTKNITAPVAAAGAALAALTRSTTNFADRVSKTAERTGVGTDALQQLRFAAEQSGASMQSVARTTDSLVRRIPQIEDGTGRAAEAFGRLGVNLRNASGEMRDQGALYTDVLRNLADMENATERNAVGTQLFGRQFRELIPLLNQGSSGIDRLMGRADELGIVMGEEDVQAFVDFKDAMHEVTESLAATGRELATAFLPVVEGMIPTLHSVIDAVGEVVEWFSNLETSTKTMIVAVAGIAAAIGPALVALGALSAAIAAISAPVALVVLGVGALVAAVVDLAVNWDQRMKELRSAFLKWFKRPILQGVEAVIGTLRSLTQFMPGVGDAMTAALVRVRTALDNVNEEIRHTQEELLFMSAIADGAFEEQDMGLFATSFRDPGEIENFADRVGAAFDRVRRQLGLLRDEEEKTTGGGGGSGGGSSFLDFFGGTPRRIGVQGQAGIAGGQGVGDITSGALAGLEGLNRVAATAAQRLGDIQAKSTVAFSVARDGALEFGSQLGQVVGDLVTMQGGITGIGDAFRSMGDVVRRTLSRMISQLAAAAAQAAALSAVISIIPGLNTIGGASSFGGLFKGFFGLAEGGIVTRPTLAMIGEGGESEAVIPLSKLSQFGGAQTIHLQGEFRQRGTDQVAGINQTHTFQSRMGRS